MSDTEILRSTPVPLNVISLDEEVAPRTNGAETRFENPPDSSALTESWIENSVDLPYAAVGRVFAKYGLVDANGNVGQATYSVGHGSGFIVGPRTIITAAHVVAPFAISRSSGLKTRLKSVKFYPMYQGSEVGGYGPNGSSWSGYELFVHADYQPIPAGAREPERYPNGGAYKVNYAADIAAIVTSPNRGELPPRRLGITASKPLEEFDGQECLGLGYPTAGRFQRPDGYYRMWESPGDFYVHRKSGNTVSEDFTLKQSDLSPGCSGGPWVPTTGQFKNFAIGLNSITTSGSDNPMISPKFDEDLQEVLAEVLRFESSINDGRQPTDSGYKRILRT